MYFRMGNQQSDLGWLKIKINYWISQHAEEDDMHLICLFIAVHFVCRRDTILTLYFHRSLFLVGSLTFYKISVKKNNEN